MATTGPRKRTGDKPANNEEFLVNYRDGRYNIHDFLRYHPGGKKVFEYYQNRSLDSAFDHNPHSKAAFHLFEEFKLNNEEKYQEYENLIDWNAPILRQVGTLGDRYWEWVNLPVNRQIRLFQSNYLEILSITPWYLIPIIWIPVCVAFLCLGWVQAPEDHSGNLLLQAAVSYVFGLFLWTVMEYVLHRKLFHFKPPANSKILISLHFLLHGIHHKTPFDDRRLVFPPFPGLLTTRLVLALYRTLFPPAMVYFIIAGTATGYLCYDLTHYYLHHGAPTFGTYFYNLKRNHNYHHFSHHELGFGISSKIWDYVFGTSISLRKLLKPIEW
ncbi:fatty acid 2-hydroxylase isoform X2 [Megachile rotundata]|uniref:fatty acid 2-hydroxylase isoform X2 n=1 Tax=Megachile rotundata TaxID=143995 RepID=UPI003FD1B975